MNKSKLVLFAAFVMAGLALLMVGCPKKKTAPTVVISSVTPDTVLFVGDSALLRAEVANPDNVEFALKWTATGGTLDPTRDTTDEVGWRTPADTGVFKVSVVVTGTADDTKDTASKNMHVREWVHSQAEVDNNNTISIPYPGPGTAVSPDTFPEAYGDTIPPGAIVDSVVAYFVDIRFGSGNPDSTPDMNVWIQSPDSAQVQIWNDQEGAFPDIGISAGPWGMFRGKPVAGIWKLIVTTTQAAQHTGAIEDFDLIVYFRYPGK